MAFNFNLPSTTTSYANLASFPATGSSSILYKALNNNKLYTWDGTKYNEVDKKFASSWGSVSAAPESTSVTKDEVGLGNVDNTSDVNKPVSTATQTALNAKQDTLVSATNIKTINGSSLLGSGNLTISGGSGSSGFKGLHALLPLTSGQSTYPSTTSQGIASSSLTFNRVNAVAFISNQDITTSALYMNVAGATASGQARILIYSDLNGLPDQKLYESTTLNCSTTGIKTATTTFNFVAGTTYWLCLHTTPTFNVSFINTSGSFPLSISGVNNPFTYVYVTATFPNAPATFGTPTLGSGNAPFIGITKA